MKYLLAVLLLVSLGTFVRAQSTVDKLKDGLGPRYSVIEANHPDSLSWYIFLIEEGTAILTDVPDYKLQSLPMLSTLTYKDGSKPFAKKIKPELFNRLVYPEPLDSRFAKLYQIDGTSNVLVIRPLFELEIEYRDFYEH